MESYENLSLRNHFMFGKICQDVRNSQLILKALLGEDITLVNSEQEKYLKEFAGSKYVRLDILAKDDKDRLYNAELQHESHDKSRKLELPQRARYYHAMLNVPNQESGADYLDMKDVYVIFICTFDPFGRGLTQYTIENRCLETDLPEYVDGAHTIFFNTLGDMRDVPIETRNMLEYIETGIPCDEATNKLEEQVREAREKEEWREEYMFANVLYNDIYGEGRAVGREEGMAAGREEAIISLYHDGVVSKETAMEKLEMTEEEFEEALKATRD